jgi:hypothetical protein
LRVYSFSGRLFISSIEGESRELIIKKGSVEYLNDCEEALLNSELGKRYKPTQSFCTIAMAVYR